MSQTRQLLKCTGRIQWWQSRTVSAAPVAGWSSSAGEGSTASTGPFSPWCLCECPTSGPEWWWIPGIWMSESEWALLARYFYPYKEFVFVTEAPQCNRMTVTGHRLQKNNIQIGNVQNSKNTKYNTDNCVWEPVWLANLKWKISMCSE